MNIKTEYRKASRGSARQIIKLTAVDVEIKNPKSTYGIDTHRSPSLTITFYENRNRDMGPMIRFRGDMAHDEVIDAFKELLDEAKRTITRYTDFSDYQI
jgi:hypothetical protein